jgi:hypothetical protein
MGKYEDLIKRLRDDEAWKNCDFDFIYGWMHEAADAIEELQKQRDECPCWYGGIRFCSMLVKPIPEPPKEET